LNYAAKTDAPLIRSRFLAVAEAKGLSAEVSNLPTAQAIGKSYDAEKKDKVNRLRVRQFWREKGEK